ncbi:MAG: beta-lactamase family protein [Bacteriovoracaceae bacterium]|jgi:CubicO group peptidase (beta-lactamase class C family)|nr:beta-lactamase family protein [Bacteriovoracaceae bacterium]
MIIRLLLVYTVSAFIVAFAQVNPIHHGLKKILVDYQLPGIGVATITPQNPLQIEVAGLRRADHPATIKSNDLFNLASCTKSMTATLAAIIVESGLISWKTTLGELYPLSHPNLRNVTLEMILAHRGGILRSPTSIKKGKFWKKIKNKRLTTKASRDLLVKKILKSKPSLTPGSTFSYSNIGYAVVAHMLETVTESSYENLMREKIFSPLGMNKCIFGQPAHKENSKNPLQPWGHRHKKGISVVSENPNSAGKGPKPLNSAGGVSCSLKDWAKYAQVHQEKNRLLQKRSFKKLHSNYPGQNYTYGGWYKTQNTLRHTGAQKSNYSAVSINLKKHSIKLFVTNWRGKNAKQIVKEIYDLLDL